MEANRDMIDPALEAMMMRSPFAELAPDEQRAALDAVGSAAAYDRMRATFIGVRSVLAAAPPSLAPRRSTLDSLHRAMKAAEPRRAPMFSLAGLLGRAVPLYKPIAAFALVLVVAAVYIAGRESGVRERVVYIQSPATAVAQVDTEAIVQRVVDSIKAELGRGGEPATVLNASNGARITPRRGRGRRGADTSFGIAQRRGAVATVPVVEGNQFVGLGNLPGLDRQRRGKSIAEDSTVGRFHSKMINDRL
jgi:hypothetical protein